MTHPSQKSQPEDDRTYSVKQDNSGLMSGGMQSIQGDNNTQYQDNRSYNSTFKFEVPALPKEIKFKSWRSRIWNYLYLLIFLIVIFVVWLFLGLFVGNVFPRSLAIELLNYVFSGLIPRKESTKQCDQEVWDKVNELTDQLSHFPDVPEIGGRKEAIRLNRRDSMYWLITQVLDVFGGNITESDAIFWQVKNIEEYRSSMSERLEVMRKKHLKEIHVIQTLTENLNVFSREKEEEKKLLSRLIEQYVKNPPPQISDINYFIEDFKYEIPKISSENNLYDFLKIVDWVSRYSPADKLNDYESINENLPLIRAWNSNLNNRYHIDPRCKDYPRVEETVQESEIDFYDSREDAQKMNRKLCKKCAKNSLE